MKSYKNLIATIMLSLATSLPIYAFDIALGDGEKSLGIKLTHNADEPFGKPLPWGPASVRFSGSGLWVADTLKNRIVEYDPKGAFIRAIPLNLPNDSTIGDFCFGIYKNQKVLYVCDADNPVIFVFNSSGKKIARIGSPTRNTILMKPRRIEFFNNKIFVLDEARSNIFVYNTDLNQEKAIATSSNNFTIEKNYLIHVTTFKSKKVIEYYNLETSERQYIGFKNLDFDKDADFDYIFCNNEKRYIGVVKVAENSDKAQYQIIQVDKEDNISMLNTDYPVSFMIRSFIKDPQGKIYQIKFDENRTEKLTIDELPENFNESEG